MNLFSDISMSMALDTSFRKDSTAEATSPTLQTLKTNALVRRWENVITLDKV